MMLARTKVALIAGVAQLLWTVPASAAIMLTDPSSFNGDVILFNTAVSGTQIVGHTNGSPSVAYVFEGSTITGPGGTIGNVLAGSGGQAVITADGYTTNHYPRMTSLSYYRQDGGAFNNTEFKIEDIERFVRNTAVVITAYAWNQNGVMTNLGQLSLGGDNRFGVIGTGGDVITRVQWVATNGAVGRHKQTRVDNVTVDGAVPEPSTWLTMLLGFGLLGGVMRRSGSGHFLKAA